MPFPERIHEPASQVVHWLSDDFSGSSIDSSLWSVSGSPSVSSSELFISTGQALLSKQGFQPPCLIEVVCTMTGRAGGDDFRLGFYTDDSNLVEWRAAGSAPANMDAVMSAGGVSDDQTGINVGAQNGQYRLASVYVGVGEAVWSFRTLGGINQRNEVYRIREHGIPSGPFRVRLAGLSTGGSSQLKVHRVQAYQLADLVPVGALGHHVDGLAIPVRLTNTPFMASPSHPGLGTVQVMSESLPLAAGASNTGSTRAGFTEQVHVQAYYSGDQPFTCWLEAQLDGSNWQTIWHGTSTDATADAVVRYYAVTPIMQCSGSRNYRVRVKNTGSSSGNFRSAIVFTVL